LCVVARVYSAGGEGTDDDVATGVSDAPADQCIRRLRAHVDSSLAPRAAMAAEKKRGQRVGRIPYRMALASTAEPSCRISTGARCSADPWTVELRALASIAADARSARVVQPAEDRQWQMHFIGLLSRHPVLDFTSVWPLIPRRISVDGDDEDDDEGKAAARHA
jgi:hypothetical protein